MIDIFTVVLPHALMALAVWRLVHRNDLDDDPALPRKRSTLIGKARPGPEAGPRA